MTDAKKSELEIIEAGLLKNRTNSIYINLNGDPENVADLLWELLTKFERYACPTTVFNPPPPPDNRVYIISKSGDDVIIKRSEEKQND